MKTQLAEFENSDFHRMETDRVVRARIDLKGVEDQVCNILYVKHRTVEHIGDDPRQTKKKPVSEQRSKSYRGIPYVLYENKKYFRSHVNWAT